MLVRLKRHFFSIFSVLSAFFLFFTICASQGIAVAGADAIPELINQTGSSKRNHNIAPSIPLPDKKPVFSEETEASDVYSVIPYSAGSEDNLPRSVRFKIGLDAAFDDRGIEAQTFKNSFAIGSVERQTLAWAIVSSLPQGVSTAQLWQDKIELNNWPGQAFLQNNFEKSLVQEDEDLSDAQIIAYFVDKKPQTVIGKTLLAKAYLNIGQKQKARSVILPWWYNAQLTQNNEAYIETQIGVLLTKNDYRKRFEAQLYRGQQQAAARIATKGAGGEDALLDAFIAARKVVPDTEKKLKNLPKYWQKRAISVLVAIQSLRRSKQYEKAAKLLISTPASIGNNDNSYAWWVERRVLSREMLDIKRPDLAYKIAADYQTKNKIYMVDAAFHAGWYALRFLNQPDIAQEHFADIIRLSSTPVSLGRGYYWLARAQQDLGETHKAILNYKKAAQYPTSFYGQLAAQHLGKKNLNVPLPHPTQEEKLKFNARKPVQGLILLEKAGYGQQALSLYNAISYNIHNVGELAQLAALAETNNNYYSSLKIGKTGLIRHLKVGALAYPLGAIPKKAGTSAQSLALAYAVGYQESEFNIQALSHANARGLLQLMPMTAKDVAQRHDMLYSLDRLSNDAGYNARLGTHYLQEQLDKFQGSYILTFIAYNAGASRAQDWITRYGDPRGKDTDCVIDWIERIPFTETRNYVQRVIENYEIYKTRLGASFDIEADITAGQPD